MKKKFKLLDTISIFKENQKHRIHLGRVGTREDILSNVDYEVKFSDKSGETIAEFSVSADDLLLLNHTLEYSPK